MGSEASGNGETVKQPVVPLPASAWAAAAGIGLGAAMVMYAIMKPLLIAGVCPFNVPPSVAVFLRFDWPAPAALGLALHFAYGTAGALLLAGAFKRRVTIWHGLGLAAVLWLVLMVVYSPLIGWGFFGIGGPGSALPPEAPLHLGWPLEYMVATFTLHVVYGALVGGLEQRFLSPSRRHRRT